MKTTPCKRFNRCMTAILLTSAIFGCSNDRYSLARSNPATTNVQSSNTAGQTPYAALLEKHQPDDPHVLRIRADEERHRLWVLTLERVYVYDTRALTLIRRIGLPDWSVADFDFMCPPDIVLDQRGTAFVSNNVQPRLLQIGADFETTEHQLTLVSGKQLDVGFGSLAFGPNGDLFGLSAVSGLVFKIDLGSRDAREVVSSRRRAGACVLDAMQNTNSPQPAQWYQHAASGAQ
jgi:hypothetical protein